MVTVGPSLSQEMSQRPQGLNIFHLTLSGRCFYNSCFKYMDTEGRAGEHHTRNHDWLRVISPMYWMPFITQTSSPPPVGGESRQGCPRSSPGVRGGERVHLYLTDATEQNTAVQNYHIFSTHWCWPLTGPTFQMTVSFLLEVTTCQE